MEKNLFWFHNLDQQSPNLNSLGALFDTGQQNITPAYMEPCANAVFPNGSFPSYADIGLPQSRASQPDDAHNWFYPLPRFCQAITPGLNPMPNQKPFENAGGHESLKIGTGCAQKRFLVFDQSGDQTTLLYSSGIGTPLPCLDSWNPKPPPTYNWLKEEPEMNRETISPSGPFLTDEYDEGNRNDDAESEMHEDTEELNALLYSDDDNDYFEDDEETSTGHSPSTMTSYGIHDLFEEKREETASCAESTKRQKLLDGSYDVPSLMDAAVVDAASSLKCFALSELEDDAESSCGNSHDQVPREFSSLSGKKRSRKENIRKIVRVLQSIIPDGKRKDAVDIIDEAIRYLRSLKAKAKDLGLDTLRF